MTIIVMAKAPIPGVAKTRLIPLLGAEGAARLHASLMRHAVATAAQAARTLNIGPVVLAVTPTATHPVFTELATQFEVDIVNQGEGSLGERMQRVFMAVHSEIAAGPMVMIGCDCPTLAAGDLLAAHIAIQEGADASLLAAEDGGYVLIALGKPAPQLLDPIDWGTDQVLAQTLEKAANNGLRARVLGTRYDIDREADYHRMCLENALPNWARV